MSTLESLFAGLKPATHMRVERPLMTMVPLALTLMPHQERAIQHALRDTVTKGYAYCAIEQGGGKTPVGIGVAAAAAQAGLGPTLVVVPPTIRINWEREFKRFAPWLRVKVLRGTATTLPDVDVMIIGDATIGSRGKLPSLERGKKHDPLTLVSDWGKLLLGNVANIVIDEAHRFKNKSRRSDAMLALAEATPGIRMLMSGTPTPNGRHQELATQVSIMGEPAWRDIGGIGVFYNYYAPPIDNYGGRGSEHADELHAAMVDSWYMRVLRKDVLELPNKGRNAVSLEAAGKGGRLVREYKLAEEDLIEYLHSNGKSTKGAERAEALVKLTTMRKLAGQCKVQNGIKHVAEILSEQPGGVFVVAEHRDVIADFTQGLMRYNPTYIQGGMSDKEKQEHIDAFVSGKSRVMIGQITAAGVGLTLHGDGINNRVVVAQLPWTPADLVQAEDRLYRIGQTSDVLVEILLCAIEGVWSIDERLWGQIETKYFRSTALNDGHGEYLLSEVTESIIDSYR